MAAKETTFPPTFEQVKELHPNLDPADYGMGVFRIAVKNDPKCQAIKATWERRAAQPSTKIKTMKRLLDTGIFEAENMLQHHSPLVKAKARKEVQDAIDALTALLKA